MRLTSLLPILIGHLFKVPYPTLECLPEERPSEFFPQVDDEIFKTQQNRKVYSKTWLLFRFHIRNYGKARAYITEYELKIKEFDFSSQEIRPRQFDRIRIETRDEAPYRSLRNPIFNTSDGSLVIDAEQTTNSVELPFPIDFLEAHRTPDDITAELTLTHGSSIWNRRKFCFETQMKSTLAPK